MKIPCCKVTSRRHLEKVIRIRSFREKNQILRWGTSSARGPLIVSILFAGVP